MMLCTKKFYILKPNEKLIYSPKLPKIFIAARYKTFVAHEKPTLNGYIFRQSVIKHAKLALSSTNENIYQKLLLDEGKIALTTTVEELAKKLDEYKIEYTIIGGIALNVHGFKRQTNDVDVLLTPDGLKILLEKIVYNGIVPRFRGARKSFRNPNTNVGIDVITSGEYPGDGKPKSISFPIPSQSSIDISGIKIISLPNLINLKLASYLSLPTLRMKDRVDVAGLVKHLTLDESLCDKLHNDIRTEYLKIVQEVIDEEKGET